LFLLLVAFEVFPAVRFEVFWIGILPQHYTAYNQGDLDLNWFY